MLQVNSNLKLKYSLIGIFFIWVCIAVSAYPVWAIAQVLAEVLNVPEGVPVREQDNGWLWFVLFCVEGSAIFGLVYSLLGYIFSIAVGWSFTKYIAVFFKSKYPPTWCK